MTTTTSIRRGTLGFLVAASLLGCDNQGGSSLKTPAPPAVETSSATLSLRAASAGAETETVAVDVNYFHKADRTAPRMMELFVRYTDGFTYESAEALTAVTAAGKQLVVQDQGGGLLRVIVYASGNTTTLGSGGLLRLTFDTHGKSGTVSLESRMPIFAPAEANDGVLLGPPLELSPGKGAP